jgi:hypothetical protein
MNFTMILRPKYNIMKNLIKGLALLSMLSLFSCTKTLYTHEQVLDRYKTKQAVAAKFGVPTEKIMSDTTDEWLYRYEGHRFSDEYHNTNAASVPGFNIYKKYLIFSFDKQGNVVKRDGHGLNFTERKSETGWTIALIAIGAGLIAVLIIAGNALSGISSY